MTSMLPLLQRAAIKGEHVEALPMQFPPTVAQTVGFEVVSVERGTAVYRLDVLPEKHANPMGTVHGGILVVVADSAMGMACLSLLEQGESFTTIELKTNYFRPLVAGQIEARAKVVNAGRSLVYLECDVVTVPTEKLIAKAVSTCLVLRGDQAKGR